MPSSRHDEGAEASAGYRLGDMSVADLDDVLAIERASFATPWTREQFLHEIEGNPIARNPVLRDLSGRVAAFACIWIVAPELHLNDFAVAPALRGRGLGRTLLGFVLEIGRRERCGSVTLEVRPSNGPAIRLYRRFGFLQVGLRRAYYSDSGEDAVLMERTLEPGT